MPPLPDNPRGFWESDVLVATHQALLAAANSSWADWRALDPRWLATRAAARFRTRIRDDLIREYPDDPLVVIKDPRICRFVPFFRSVLDELEIAPLILLPLRKPLEVAYSLKRRDGFAISKSLLIWLRHVLEAELYTRDLPRHFLRYDDFLLDWRRCTDQAAAHLGIRWPRNSSQSSAIVEQFLSTKLHRERCGVEEMMAHPEMSSLVKEAYLAFDALAQNGESAELSGRLDGIRQRFEEDCALFGAVCAAEEQAAQKVGRERAALISANEELRVTLAAAQAQRGELLAQVETDKELLIRSEAERAELITRLQAEKDAFVTSGQAEKEAFGARMWAEKNEFMARTKAEQEAAREELIARLQAEKDAFLTSVQVEKDAFLTSAQAEKEAFGAKLWAEKNEFIARTKAEQEAEREELIARLQAEKDAFAANVQAEKEAFGARMWTEKNELITELEARHHAALAAIEAERDQLIAKLQSEHDRALRESIAERETLRIALAEKTAAFERSLALEAELRAKIRDYQQLSDEQRRQHERLSQELARSTSERKSVLDELSRVRREADELSRALAILRQQHELLEAKLAEQQRTLAAIYGSNSWRLTRPLRLLRFAAVRGSKRISGT